MAKASDTAGKGANQLLSFREWGDKQLRVYFDERIDKVFDVCCFSQPVTYVADTSIFCRMGAKGNQVVIYSMTIEASNDLAMVLPVPVAEQRNEESVQFVDLSNYPKFFTQLDRGFPQNSFGNFGDTPKAQPARSTLEVKQVGSYSASFVPTVDDFDRLEPAFRIPSDTWKELPEFSGYGFVVFKLRQGKHRVHPMAFAYPARDKSRIVFPTVHIHDGEVHQKAEFDHSLYCQSTSGDVKMNWQESLAPMGRYILAPAAKGLIRGNEHCYKLSMMGELDNSDVEVPA